MGVTPFVKQLFVSLSPFLAGLSVGGAVSFPTVLLHQLKADDSSIHLDFNTASWIGAIHGLAGLPSIFVPTIMQSRGRKFAFIAACLVSIIGWILVFTAKSPTAILISESFHGLGSNSIYAVTCLSLTEMIAPRYRDTFLQIFYITECTSMAITGLMMQYLHWKTISIIMCIPMIFALLIAFMWPESPYWLAYKGEFAKCEKAFLWLRGSNADSAKELNELILAQRESHRETENRSKVTVKYIRNKITRTDFYTPCLHIFLLQYLVHGTGGLIIIIYSIELIQKATSDSTIIFLSSFLVNFILVVGYIVTIATNKYFRKKTVLMSSIIGAVVSLAGASSVSYMQNAGTLSRDSLACFICLVLYLIAISLGIMPIAYTVASVLMPVKHRGIGGAFYVTTTCLLHTITLKLAPYLFLYIKLWGTFLVFAVNGLCCGLIIWKFVPETKGRTLQEIEDFYTYGKFIAVNRKTDEDSLEQII